MEPEFDEEALKVKLLSLSIWKRIAFLLSICERLYPNFVVFARKNAYKGEDILRSSLNKAWNTLQNGKTLSDFSLDAEKCAIIAPDTEEFETILVSAALDSATSISLLMEFFTDNDVLHVVEAASLARDSVDMYVQEIENMSPNDPTLESRILKHPLMQSELVRQRKDIEFLRNIINIENSFDEIRKKWFDTKVSCLGLRI